MRPFTRSFAFHCFRRLRSVVFGVVALAVLLALPGGVLAAKPISFHANVDETFDDQICGIPVTVHARGVFTEWLVFDEGGNVVDDKNTSSFNLTFTAADGKSIRIHSAGLFTSNAEVIADGVVQFTDTYIGLPEQIKGSQGDLLLRDAGLITFVITVDFTTDPPTEVSFETTVDKGPHPEAESDFTLFCDVVLAALG